MKPFSQWTIAEVEDQFQLVQCKESQRLCEWLTIRMPPAPAEAALLTTLRERLFDHVYDWNEHELTVKFIAPLLLLVNFDQPAYQSFWDREIAASFNGDRLAGTVDFLVATGKRVPKHPYFFIHEYKKELESSNDPLGQLMIAMVAAQHLNQDGNPIYGAYVVGRQWNFVILDGGEYVVSLAYDATKDDLNAILGVLQNTKTLIDALIQGGQT